jgi:hypothetical protein
LEVVYDDLVAAIGSERGLYGLGNGTASVDVANNSSIFGVVAVVGVVSSVYWDGGVERELLLVAVLEQASIWGVGYRERHCCGM